MFNAVKNTIKFRLERFLLRGTHYRLLFIGALIGMVSIVAGLLAFSTMEDMYKFIPVWEAADRVVDDPDPQIRKRALELLTYGDRQIAIDRLELALSDPNPEINELAEALLAELEQVSS